MSSSSLGKLSEPNIREEFCKETKKSKVKYWEASGELKNKGSEDSGRRKQEIRTMESRFEP